MIEASITPEDVARAHADLHPGYDLISYGEIGLPYFELRIRAQILERKPLNPFAEFLSRSVSIGMSDLLEIQQLLGLDDRVLETTVVDLVVKEQVAVDEAGGALRLTARGKHVLDEALEIRPVATQLSVNFDGLLQEVVPPYGDYLQPRDLKQSGIREIPLPSRLQPELHRMDVRDVERVVRQLSTGREQLQDVLALKSMRRFRVFRPAIALVYRSHTATDFLVDIALDGYRSERHSLAFAEAGLAKKLGLSVALERAEERIAPVVGRHVAAILGNEERNEKMRKLKRAMRAEMPSPVPSTDGSAEAPVEVDERVKKHAARARDMFEATPVKAIETFEHPGYLQDALNKSGRRLIIVSPWLRAAVIDHGFMTKLENLLDGGVEVHIGWGISSSEQEEPNADRSVLRRLEELGTRFPSLNVCRLGNTHAKILISDDRYVIVTSFNWLSFRGDPKRTFRDERGTLVSDPKYVDEQATRMLKRFADAAAGGDL